MNSKRKYRELNALKGRITERGLNYREVARRMGVSPTTLSNKLNGYATFNLVEVSKAVGILNIKDEEVGKFFLPI